MLLFNMIVMGKTNYKISWQAEPRDGVGLSLPFEI